MEDILHPPPALQYNTAKNAYEAVAVGLELQRKQLEDEADRAVVRDAVFLVALRRVDDLPY